MPNAALFLAGCLAGAAVASIAFVLLQPPTNAARPTLPPMAEPAAATMVPGIDPAPLAAIQQQLQQLTATLEAFGQRLDALQERQTARVPVVESAAVIDDDALVRAMERADANKERAKWDKLTNPGLLQAAAESVNGHDAETARRMLEVLLDRPLTPAERALALTQLGIVDRARKDLDASAVSLQQAIDLRGTNTMEGAVAAFQMLFTMEAKGDRARALAFADAVARGPNAALAMEARVQAARLAQALGDVTRARADYAAILRDCGDRPEYQRIVEDVKRRLQGL